ncbi:dienelactone hydrolase family protein [Sneathiella marina]|uniref:Dienelactone hydrolase family protein n=1 Tax=Sneathiella marina TaxID=2950108 RepID=A0ABY4W6W1_9PROT|nr:dienelactone hydrolase family protein [Sneathiella marina]USG62596.1 dienelactone hydrolase family protein [Sneathiella marina]
MKEFETNIATVDGDMDTFVCHPDEGGPFPAVIMYMDAPGIREELRDMARRIGTAGYYVILPNLYYRWGREDNYGFERARIREDENELQKMFDLMNAATTEKIVADTRPMIDFIANDAEAKKGPLGAVGYCMSGKYIVGIGAAYPAEFAALASYYGVGIQTEEANSPHLDAHKITAELYLAFAEEDVYVPPPLLKSIPEEMEKAGINCRVEMYPGTGHGFAFPQRPAYHKQAAERHWERMLSLFERNLKS